MSRAISASVRRLGRAGKRGVSFAAVLFSSATACSHTAQVPSNRAEVVRAIAHNLAEGYIDESMGNALADSLEIELTAGTFDRLDDLAFARRVTEVLSRISNDPHLGVSYVGPKTTQVEPEPRPVQIPEPVQDPEPSDGPDRFDPRDYGFGRVAILPGGVGYLQLLGFSDDPLALEYADSILASFADVNALIIDLRENTGGGPQMVRLISTYLFNEPTHLVSTFMRGMEAPRERWTLDSVRGKRLPETPVYILTSRSTLSAAESFTFGLKANNRVTIVGERTGGGGHFGDWIDLPGGFTIFLPRGRTYDPRTNRGWETEGIEPDVSVPADVALETTLGLIGETTTKRTNPPE